MRDILMLTLLFAAWAGASVYVRACRDIARPSQPPERS
jgi:hypothetical protein